MSKKSGWFGDSKRHSDAAKSIKTGRKSYHHKRARNGRENYWDRKVSYPNPKFIYSKHKDANVSEKWNPKTKRYDDAIFTKIIGRKKMYGLWTFKTKEEAKKTSDDIIKFNLGAWDGKGEAPIRKTSHGYTVFVEEV
jgi:hypothetical protein